MFSGSLLVETEIDSAKNSLPLKRTGCCYLEWALPGLVVVWCF